MTDGDIFKLTTPQSPRAYNKKSIDRDLESEIGRSRSSFCIGKYFGFEPVCTGTSGTRTCSSGLNSSTL